MTIFSRAQTLQMLQMPVSIQKWWFPIFLIEHEMTPQKHATPLVPNPQNAKYLRQIPSFFFKGDLKSTLYNSISDVWSGSDL